MKTTTMAPAVVAATAKRSDAVAQYWPLRKAAHRFGLRSKDLLPELEKMGAELLRFAGRVFVREEDLVALVRESRKLTKAEARSRAQLISRLASEEVLGERPPRRSGAAS